MLFFNLLFKIRSATKMIAATIARNPKPARATNFLPSIAMSSGIGVEVWGFVKSDVLDR